MNVRLQVRTPVRDIRDADLVARGAALAQAQADITVEQVWRTRVRQNEARRRARVRAPISA